MPRLLTVVLLFLGVTIYCGPKVVHAQNYSTVDTVSTAAVEGFGGDTVTVTFNLVNTFAVGGFQFRMTYDSTVFTPLAMQLAPRSSRFDLSWFYLGDPEIVRFGAASTYARDSAIAAGSGPVATLDMAINPAAAPGAYFLRFVNSDSFSHENSLSDSFGTLIIPVFAESSIQVLQIDSAEEPPGLPEGFGLGQNYPNPFNGETRITFSLGTPSRVELSVIDLLGRVVATPYIGEAPAGTSSTIWDGRSSAGQDVTSGIYFYRLIDSGGNSVTQKMMLLK